MTEMEAKTKLFEGLSKIYGMQEGLRMAGTVVPGILNDFVRMLNDRHHAEEEYRLEDGRAKVFIAGRRTGGRVTIDFVNVVEGRRP